MRYFNVGDPVWYIHYHDFHWIACADVVGHIDAENWYGLVCFPYPVRCYAMYHSKDEAEEAAQILNIKTFMRRTFERFDIFEDGII